MITRHINNIFKDKEVDEKSNVQNLHIANSDKPVRFYSLDIVLAVGYRTNSAKAIKFRQWATRILKNYIYKGYAINGEKITHQRFKALENEVNILKQKVQQLENQNIKQQGIFFDGQIFDAYKFTNDLIKTAKESIILIDNYIDESVLNLFSKVPNIKVKIYTKNITAQLKLDLRKYKQQYNNLEIKRFEKSHDRFLIIDHKDVYHIGASLKDLGKKWFAFSKLDINTIKMLDKLTQS